MVGAVARGDIQNDSGMESRVFEEFVKPVETRQGAPWLRKYTEDGREVIRVIDTEGHRARIATPDEIRDGQFFKDFAEYQAARAA